MDELTEALSRKALPGVWYVLDEFFGQNPQPEISQDTHLFYCRVRRNALAIGRSHALVEMGIREIFDA